MAQKFNLNVFSYDIEELEDLLSLEKPYSKNHLYQSCDALRKQLFADESQTENDKAALNGFLKSYKISKDKTYKQMNIKQTNLFQLIQLKMQQKILIL